MELDKNTFEQWMRNLSERLDRQERMLSRLTDKEDTETFVLDGERLMDNQDVCQILHISKRTLQRYRSTKLLRYQMLGHKVYYKESDVKEFLKNNFEIIGGQVRWREPQSPSAGTNENQSK